MKVSGGLVATGVVVAVIAAGCAAAGTISLLPTEHSGSISQVSPISVSTKFPAPASAYHATHAVGLATPVKAAAPDYIGHGGGQPGTFPDGTSAGSGSDQGAGHHVPGHGGFGHGGSGSHHGGPVHTSYPGSK